MKTSKEMQACIDECLRCYRICLGTAMTHCLEAGGEHVASRLDFEWPSSQDHSEEEVTPAGAGRCRAVFRAVRHSRSDIAWINSCPS